VYLTGKQSQRGDAGEGRGGEGIHLGGLVGARPVWVLLLSTNGSHMLAYIVCLMSGANWTRAIVDLYQAQEPDEVSALNHAWPRPRNNRRHPYEPMHREVSWTYMLDIHGSALLY
jgi:hypothetical protein